MTDSPAKRRKTSPTTSFPIDAPATPSRIPVLSRPSQQQDVSAKPNSPRRPSFASPTRASLARHNPELLKRPTSSGNLGGTPVRKNPDDVFAKALSQTRPSIEEDVEGNTAPRRGGSQEVIRASRALGGALSAKPRRLSRSPAKSGNAVEKVRDAPDLGGMANPFAKKGGLRRSPTFSSQVDSQPEPSQEEFDPFARKTRVRRSPESSQDVAASQELESAGAALRRSPVMSETDEGMDNIISKPVQEELVGPPRKNALNRSPIPSQTDTTLQEFEPLAKTGLRRSPRLPSTDTVSQDLGPTKKAGLRKSPPSQIDAMVQAFSPVKKAGLRRSPPVIRPSVSLGHSELQIEKYDDSGQVKETYRSSPETVIESVENQVEVLPEQFGTTPPGPPPSKALHSAPRLSKGFDEEHPHGVSKRPFKAPEPRNESSPITVASPVEPSQLETRAEVPKPSDTAKAVEPVGSTSLLIEAEKQKPMQPISKMNEPTIVTKPLSEKQTSREASSSQARSSNLQKHKPVTKTAPPKEPSPDIILERHPDPPVDKDPDLPLTPTQLGLKDPVVTTPPAGIHNTSSKGARRKKALAKVKSSPLKPRDDRPNDASAEPISVPDLIPDSQVFQREKPKRRKSARFLVPIDPHAEKKSERDALLKQLQDLQADIAIGNQETERLRLLQDQKRVASNPKASDHLIAMLLRSRAPEHAVTKVASTSIFNSIEAFLPFRSRRRQAVKPTALSILEKPLPSFLPTAMDDPLPYLQALSPLNYTSTIHLLPAIPSSPDDDTTPSQLQQHLISASHPSGLFFSRFSLTVNTSNFSTPSLDIIRLDPASESELGTYLREMAAKKNLSVFCWAMGRWAEVALKRAAFWCAINAEFGNVEARHKSLERLKLKGKRKRGDDDGVVQQAGWSRKQLLPMIPRTHYEVVSEEIGVCLRVEWKLEFDWVGDCESVVEAVVGVPASWKQRDDRNSFTKIPEMFRRLVKEKGPLGAVRTTVGLLMSDA